MKALIFGAPGSGKGTYGSRLQTKLDVDLISTGDIFRAILKEDTPLGRKVKSYVETGQLVSDEITLKVLKKRLAEVPEGHGFILDGYPRTLAQAEALDKIAKIDVVLLLDVPEWIIIGRYSGRRVCKNCGAVYNIQFLKPKVENVCNKCGGPLYQRPDDTAEVMKNRLDIYEKQTRPLVQYYKEKKTPFIVHTTSSLETPPETAVEYFITELKKLKLS